MNNGRTKLLGRSAAALACCFALFGGSAALAGKPAGGAPTSSPCNAEFRNGGTEAIVDDSKGIYRNGVDGTRCQVDSAANTSGADLLFTLNFKRSRTTRAAVVKLDNAISPAQPRGQWTVGGLFHIHINDFGLVPVGTSIEHRAHFHIPYNGQDHKLRFQFEPNDGTALCRITRVSSNVWTIESLDNHASRLWIGGAFGDPTVFPPALGDYIVPFHLTITLQ